MAQDTNHARTMKSYWEKEALEGYLPSTPSLDFTFATVFLCVVTIGRRSKVSSSVVIPVIASVLEIYKVKLFKSPAQSSAA